MKSWDTAKQAARSGWPSLLVAAAVAVLHATALCPTVFLGDSGEIAAAIATGGVSHPPGYPLFTLLGRMACVLIPWGEPAWRIGWVVVAASAVAAGFWVAAARRVGAGGAVAVLLALILATRTPYAIQATRVEVYTVQSALFAAMLWIAIRLRETAGSRPAMWFWALAGFSAAHHTTTLLAVPGLIVLAGATGRRTLRCPRNVAWVCIGPFLYAELVRRGLTQPILDWGGIRDLAGLLRHASGALYGTWLEWPSIPALGRIIRLGTTLMHPLLVVFAVVGWWLNRSSPARIRARAVFGIAAPTLAFATFYGIPDIGPYLFVPVAAMLPWVAAGCEGLLQRLSPRFRAGATVAGIGFTLAMVGLTRSDWDLSDAVGVRALAVGKLESCPPGAVLVTTGDNDHFPLVYAQSVLGKRRDVQLVSRDLLRHAWLQRSRDPSLWYPSSLIRSGVPIGLPGHLSNEADAEWGNDGALIRLLEGPWKSRPLCTTFVRALPAGARDPLRINAWLRERRSVVPRGLVVLVLNPGTPPDDTAITAFNRSFWAVHALPSLAGVRADGEVTPDYVARYYADMLIWTAAVDEQAGGSIAATLRRRLSEWAPDLQ